MRGSTSYWNGMSQSAGSIRARRCQNGDVWEGQGSLSVLTLDSPGGSSDRCQNQGKW
jgi:hypothetical protein